MHSIPSIYKILITVTVIAILFVLGVVYFLGKSLPTSDTQKIVFPKSPAEVVGLSDAEKAEVVAAITREGSIENCSAFEGIVVEGTDYMGVCKDNLILKQAAEDNNPALCKNLSNIDVGACERDAVSLVLETGSIPACDPLTTEIGKTFCSEEVAIYQAVKSGDESKCSSLSGNQDYCKQMARLSIVLGSGKSAGCDSLLPTLQKGCKEYFVKYEESQNVSCLSAQSSLLFQDMCQKIRSIQ